MEQVKTFLQNRPYFFGGANPEQLMDNKYTRSKGFFPEEWLGYGETTNYFHHGGGLNMRGYAGYWVVENANLLYKGNSGVAVNVELEFDNFFKFKPKPLKKIFKLDTYLFGDAGTMVYQKLSDAKWKFGNIRMDAGIGVALTIKKFWLLETVKPLTIRFDMPLILSHIPFLDSQWVDFRWVVGVNRAF